MIRSEMKSTMPTPSTSPLIGASIDLQTVFTDLKELKVHMALQTTQQSTPAYTISLLTGQEKHCRSPFSLLVSYSFVKNCIAC